MKHNKLSISIVSAFIAALGLSACSSAVTEGKDNALVSFVGHNNETKVITADEIFNKIKGTEDGVTSFYNAILEVMIRDYFENTTSLNAKYETFKESSRDKVRADHKKAKSDAKTNGTSYEEEWQAILDANGVKTEKELELKYLYGLEKEEYMDMYFDDAELGHVDELTKEYINEVLPYHIRHILVKTEGASATDYVTSEITQEQATNLATVYKMLANSDNTFGEIAFQKSDDGSKSSYGDAGIMTTKTSFVNEFKLGIYAYDCMYAKDVQGKAEDKANKLGLDGQNEFADVADHKVSAALDKIGLQTVPFAAFEFLGAKADVTKDEKGNKVNDGVAKSFPRNVIWNNYLNIHNPFVITDETIEGMEYDAVPAAKDGKTGFRVVEGLDGIPAGTKVLTDEDNRVIVGVRSEYGIHFMVMERTPFEATKTMGSTIETSLAEYYTTKVPGKDGYPTYTVKVDGKDVKKDKITYVNSINASTTEEATRATTVKNEIKGFDKYYDYRLFEYFLESGRIDIKDDAVEAQITNLMKVKRENAEWTAKKDLNTSWNTYLDKLELQYSVRGDNYGADLDASKRLVKVTCAVNFENGGADFEKGGICYYEA